MPFFDLPLDQLETYQPERDEPGDFDAFWVETLADARSRPLDVRLDPHPLRLPLIESYDVTFPGFGGQSIHGLFLRPASDDPLPVVVHFLGYGDGSGSPLERLAWPVAGFAMLVMDTRGQGAGGRAGRTGDHSGTANAHVAGFLTQGVLDPRDYYYRRVFTDAVRAVDAALALPGVDRERVAVNGTSQGGAIALAAAGLHQGVAAAMVNVPFLCNVQRALDITDAGPYAELLAFLRSHRHHVKDSLRTVSYVDGMTMASRAHAPALFSVALMDEVCPPSTVFAAYNHYVGSKEVVVYPYNGHEGGGVDHQEREIHWLRERFGQAAPPPLESYRMLGADDAAKPART